MRADSCTHRRMTLNRAHFAPTETSTLKCAPKTDRKHAPIVLCTYVSVTTKRLVFWASRQPDPATCPPLSSKSTVIVIHFSHSLQTLSYRLTISRTEILANPRYSPRPCLRFHCTLARALANDCPCHAFLRAPTVSDGNDAHSNRRTFE